MIDITKKSVEQISVKGCVERWNLTFIKIISFIYLKQLKDSRNLYLCCMLKSYFLDNYIVFMAGINFDNNFNDLLNQLTNINKFNHTIHLNFWCFVMG